MLFVAGFAHPPNVDAAIFLMQEVMPRLEAQIGPGRCDARGLQPD